MYFNSCLKVGRGNRGSGPSAGKCWWAGFSRFHSRMLDGADGIVFVLCLCFDDVMLVTLCLRHTSNKH